MNWTYEGGRLLSHIVLDGCFPGDCSGREYVPKTGPLILAANHASFLDPPALGRHVPREICYFARKSLFKPGLIGRILTRVNAIPVDRDGESDIGSIKRVLRELKEGRGILFFPEGTRSPDGRLQEPKPGLGMIACKARVPITPARIFGSYEALGRNNSFPLLDTPVSVAFAPPLLPDAYDPGPNAKDRYLRASRRIMQAIRAIPPPSGTG